MNYTFYKVANRPVFPQTDGRTMCLYRCCIRTNSGAQCPASVHFAKNKPKKNIDRTKALTAWKAHKQKHCCWHHRTTKWLFYFLQAPRLLDSSSLRSASNKKTPEPLRLSSSIHDLLFIWIFWCVAGTSTQICPHLHFSCVLWCKSLSRCGLKQMRVLRMPQAA